MKVVGWTPSILAGTAARVYRLASNTRIHAIQCNHHGEAITFSFYAKTIDGNKHMRVTIEGPHSSQTKDFHISHQWSRHSISMRNSISLAPTNVFLKVTDADTPHHDIAIALPQCDAGLYATSPIPPDIELPCHAKADAPNEAGATRGTDRLWTDKIEINSRSATIIFVGSPTPAADEILATDFLACFSLWSESEDTELSIGISGQHHARFALRITEPSNASIICSDHTCSNSIHLVCAVFDDNTLSIIVDGAIIIRHRLPRRLNFGRTYVGCSHTNDQESFCGDIFEWQIFSTPILYPRILELYKELCPDNQHATLDYMLRYFRYSVTDESQNATLTQCLSDVGFSFFCKNIDFAVPLIFDQFAPGKPFKEEDVRDHVMALMTTPGVRATRECYTKIGRTDLVLEHTAIKVGTSESTQERRYRIEFKIWGRDGYRDIPTQPLKYMSPDELVGASILIDRRQATSIDAFKAIVSANTAFPCVDIKEIQILNSNLRYFVSFHRDTRIRMLRMMINILLPIPD